MNYEKHYYPIFIGLLFICHQAAAQITLNPAVDTINNKANNSVVRILSAYLNARLNKKDGKVFWLPAESERLKTYDFYDAHSLYQIKYDNIIILGITQPENGLYKIKVLFSYMGTDKVETIWAMDDFYLLKQNNTFKLTNALYANMRLDHYKTVKSSHINYHFPLDYHYRQSEIDSANYFLQALGRFFDKPAPDKIEYVTAPTCESLYAVLARLFRLPPCRHQPLFAIFLMQITG